MRGFSDAIPPVGLKVPCVLTFRSQKAQGCGQDKEASCNSMQETHPGTKEPSKKKKVVHPVVVEEDTVLVPT